MKKVFSVGMVLSLATMLALSGCSSSSSSSSSESNGGSKEFTYWYPWGGDSEKWDKQRIADYEKEEGVKVNAVYVPDGITNGKLLSAITGGNPPDLVLGDGNDYQLAYSLAAQGALEPLDKYLEKAGFDENSVLDGFRPLMKQDGKTYILPQDSNVNLLYYNVDMFKAAGLDPDNPPKTIEELDKAAEALTKIGDDGSFKTLGFIPWIDAGEDPYTWAWSFGASMYDTEAKKVVLNEKPMVDAFNWMDSYAKKYNPEKIKSFTSGFGGAFSPDHPFMTGKVAMTVSGNWFANALKTYSPNTNYRVASIPSPPGGRKDSTVFGTNVFFIPKGAKHPQEAVNFALYGNQDKVLADNINIWRSISIWKEKSDAIKWDNDQVYETVLKVASSPDSGHPALTSVASEMGDELTSIRDDVIYNHKDPVSLLQKAQEKLQEKLNKK